MCKSLVLVTFINTQKTHSFGDAKMAATPKGPQKVRIDYSIDKPTYDDFVRQCSRKGYAPGIVVEKMMRRYTETGQI